MKIVINWKKKYDNACQEIRKLDSYIEFLESKINELENKEW